MKNEKQEEKVSQLHMCKKGGMVVFTTKERDRYATSLAMLRKFSTDKGKHYLYVDTESDNLKRLNAYMKTKGKFGERKDKKATAK